MRLLLVFSGEAADTWQRELRLPRSTRLSDSLVVERTDVFSKQSRDLCISAYTVLLELTLFRWCSRDGREFAIKKFKPDKEGETVAQYSGISQSAVREMAVMPLAPRARY